MADERFDQSKYVAWLRTQSREVLMVIAARSALRVFPAIAWALEEKSQERATAIVLPLFRAMVLPWAAAKYPAHGKEVLKAASTSTAVVASYPTVPAASASASSAAIDAAAVAAVFAAADTSPAKASYAAVSSTAAAASTAAVAAYYAAASADGAADAASYAAAKADWTAIDRGQSATDLARLPLWQGQPVPDWARRSWRDLKSTLLGLNEDWDVWTGWYEDRLHGGDAIEKLEIARASLPEELWEQGAAVVNAKLKQIWEEEAGEAKAASRKGAETSDEEQTKETNPDLEQRPAPYGFERRGHKIEAAPMREPPTDLDLAEDILDELRKKSQNAINGLNGNHADPRVLETVQSFLTCIQDEASEIREGRLLMRFRALEADTASYLDPASERERSIRATIDDLTRCAEDLLALYPKIRVMEAHRQALRFTNDPAAYDVYRQAVAVLAKNADASPAVGQSATEALNDGNREQDILTEVIETTTNETTRAEAIEKRSQIAGLQALDVRNYGSAALKWVADEFGPVGSESWKAVKKAIPEGLGKGTEAFISTSMKAGPVVLVASMFGSFAAIAVAISSFLPLAKRAEEIKEDLESGDKASDEGGPGEAIDV